MYRPSDVSTHELTRACLRLADDLIFTPQQYDDRTFYHVEQPSRSRFFKIGWAEYVLISLLDGKTSLAEAVSRTARVLGREAFTESEATAICAWLLDHELAVSTEAAGARSVQSSTGKKGGIARRLNPFWMKVPLINPDRSLQALLPWVGWLHAWPVLLLSLIGWLIAAAAIGMHWEEFTRSARGVLAPSNWLWLGAAWLGLKLLHEFNHALVCKRYGGPVPEMGAILVLFAPLAYVDVTSSWGFRSRWRRMHVAAAGMMVEFHVAALCAWWWLQTDSPALGHVLFTVIFMASLTTVLFNANPLMRFDGYYLLSDLVNVPNLSSNGSQYLRGLVSRWLLGTPSRQVGWRGLKGGIIRLYAVLAFFWRIVVCVGLILAASLLFHGAGLVLAAFAVLTWLAVPVGQAVLLWGRQAVQKPRLVLRLVVAVLMLLGGFSLTWNVVPWPGARRADGITEWAPLSVVRAEVAGFVEEVLVKDGQHVNQGAPLLRLRNEDLETEFQQLQLEIEQSLIKGRTHRNAGEIASAQVEDKHREALQKQLAELEQQRGRLIVRAPIPGRVMARELVWVQQTYLKEGDAILEIGEPRQKELQLAISQPNIETFRQLVGQTVPIRLRSGQLLSGQLIKLSPRATLVPLHPALCAPVGGPLAVRGDTIDQEKDEEYELVEPHLEGTVALPPETSAALEAGLVGVISLRNSSDTLGKVAYRRVTRWLRERRDLFEAENRK